MQVFRLIVFEPLKLPTSVDYFDECFFFVTNVYLPGRMCVLFFNSGPSPRILRCQRSSG